MKPVFHIFHLGIKELLSLYRDPVLLFLIAYCFTFSVYTPSKSAVMDVVNASIAIVNEDDSEAAREIRAAMLPPQFRPAALRVASMAVTRGGYWNSAMACCCASSSAACGSASPTSTAFTAVPRMSWICGYCGMRGR